jgi:hypothetical protein
MHVNLYKSLPQGTFKVSHSSLNSQNTDCVSEQLFFFWQTIHKSITKNSKYLRQKSGLKRRRRK